MPLPRLIGRAAAILSLAAAGCGPQLAQKQIPVTASDPVARVKTMLKGYADGQSLGSEVTTYPDLVAEVRKADAAKADTLEKGLAELQKPGVNVKAKAKELHDKL